MDHLTQMNEMDRYIRKVCQNVWVKGSGKSWEGGNGRFRIFLNFLPTFCFHFLPEPIRYKWECYLIFLLNNPAVFSGIGLCWRKQCFTGERLCQTSVIAVLGAGTELPKTFMCCKVPLVLDNIPSRPFHPNVYSTEHFLSCRVACRVFCFDTLWVRMFYTY